MPTAYTFQIAYYTNAHTENFCRECAVVAVAAAADSLHGILAAIRKGLRDWRINYMRTITDWCGTI